VQNAPIPARFAVADYLDAFIGVLPRSDADQIVVMVKLFPEAVNIEPSRQDQDIIGIHDKAVVYLGHCPKKLERNGPVSGEVLPRALDDLARHTLGSEPIASQVLSTVRRPGVLDQDVVDQRANAAQAIREDMRLIPYDHAQPDFGHRIPFQAAPTLAWIGLIRRGRISAGSTDLLSRNPSTGMRRCVPSDKPQPRRPVLQPERP
jgi:hypothetical protein